MQPLLTCPISRKIMRIPVALSDGHTYELCEIQKWLQTKQTSPMTRVAITEKNFTVNYSMKQIIENYMAEHPDADRYENYVPKHFFDINKYLNFDTFDEKATYIKNSHTFEINLLKSVYARHFINIKTLQILNQIILNRQYWNEPIIYEYICEYGRLAELTWFFQKYPEFDVNNSINKFKKLCKRSFDDKIDMIKLLVSHNLQIEPKYNDIDSPLCILLHINDLETIKYLVSTKMKLCDEEALKYMIGNKMNDLINIFIENGIYKMNIVAFAIKNKCTDDKIANLIYSNYHLKCCNAIEKHSIIKFLALHDRITFNRYIGRVDFRTKRKIDKISKNDSETEDETNM